MVNYLKNIYLADDDSDDVSLFEYALRRLCLDCRLTVSSDGAELLDKLMNAGEVPDIIFIDINMPKLNGFEALEKIKHIPALQSIPVIIYSTSKNERDVLTALKTGASSYLVKPSDMACLEKLIARVLSFDWAGFIIPERPDKFILGT